MKKILLWLFVVIALVGIVSANQVDNQTTGGGTQNGHADDASRQYSSFNYTPAVTTYSLENWSIWLRKVGDGHDISLIIYTCTSAGLPDTVITDGHSTNTVLKADITGSFTPFNFSFNSPTITQGVEYCITLNSPSAGGGHELAVDARDVATHLHGRSTDNTSPDWNVWHTDRDLRYIAYGQSIIPTAPVISFLYPQSGEIFSGDFTGQINVSLDEAGNCSQMNDTRFTYQVPLSNTTYCSFLNNSVLPIGDYNINISAWDTDGPPNNDSALLSFILDDVNPTITWTFPSNSNNSVSHGTLTPTIALADSNLFSYQYNISYASNGSLIQSFLNHTFVDDLTTFTINNATDLSSFSEPLEAVVRVCDGHTKQIIEAFDIEKTQDKIQFDDTYIKSLDTTTDARYTKQRDKYSFEFEYATPKSRITIEVPEDCVYIANSGYKGHFACDEAGKWIDFEGEDTISVSGNVVTATSKKPKKIWSFNSFGELNCVTEAVRFETVNSSFEYATEVIETGLETFTIVFNHTNNDFNVTGSLVYNQTHYTASSVSGTNQTNLTVSINIPFNLTDTVNVNSTVPFHWNFTINNTNFISSTANQLVYRIILNDCLTHRVQQTLNFSILNVSNDATLNASFEASFDVWVGQKSTNFRNYSFNPGTLSSSAYCIYPHWASYSTDASVVYTHGGTAYNYHLQNASITNTSQAISLYVADGTTQVAFTVTDQNNDALEGALLFVLAYDTGTNSYDTVEILETDYRGVALGNIILNTQPYKFLINFGGQLVFESTNTFITGTSRTFRVFLGSDYYQTFNVVQGITSSLTFNNATGTFSYTFSDSSGGIANGCLKVIQRTASNDNVVNDTCVSSAASTILVPLGNSTEIGAATYVATGYVDINAQEFITDTLSASFDFTHKVFKEAGIFVTFLLTVALAMIGLFSPIVAVVLATLALFLSNVLGIFHLGWEYLITYIILAGITIYKLGRNSQ